MKKILALTLIGLFVMGNLAMAADIGDFLKGEDEDNPLDINLGIAKIIKKDNGPDVRIQLDRQSAIDKITDGEYRISVILEF